MMPKQDMEHVITHFLESCHIKEKAYYSHLLQDFIAPQVNGNWL